MKTSMEHPERREIDVAARRYRRAGYSVFRPGTKSPPDFLGDFVPDLIAERDDDKVVVEIKRNSAIRGSNEIVEIAERIAKEPGWRFELVALPATSDPLPLDLSKAGDEVKKLFQSGLLVPAYVVATVILDNVVLFALSRQGLNPNRYAFPTILRELVIEGVLDEETRSVIEQARTNRHVLLQRGESFSPSRREVEALMTLAGKIEREITAAEHD